ncbi:MAG: four helix bundle protein [Acidobacteria bacterium]|nr:four helix bundle protein [Acidobacteriota bacterium]
MSNSYRDLIVWQVSMELVTNVYRVTEAFPKHETYGLSGQMRRAAVSIPSNIVEGQGRNSRREFHQFLGQAKGSLVELETQLMIAGNLGYITADQLQKLLQSSERVSRLLNGLLKSLRQAESAPSSKNEKPETRNQKQDTPA